MLRSSFGAVLMPLAHTLSSLFPEKRTCRRQRGLQQVTAETLEVRQLLTGDLVWARSIGGTGIDRVDEVAVDSSGNVITAGVFQGTVDFDPGLGVVSLNSTGIWDTFIAKHDNAGNLVWARRMGGTDIVTLRGLAVDATGSIYASGHFEGQADFNPSPSLATTLVSAGQTDGFVVKLDAAGNFVWASRYGSTGHDVAVGLVVNPVGEVLVAGYFSGTVDFNPSANATSNLTSAGAEDIFLFRLNSAGAYQQAVRIGGTEADIPTSLKLDAAGSPHLAGRFNGTVDFDPGSDVSNLTSTGFADTFIARLDTSLDLLWVRRFGGADSDNGANLTVDEAGNVYATGGFERTIDFDPGSGIENLNSAGGTDIFVQKLTPAGVFVWARRMGAAGTDIGTDIAVDQDGDVYISGRFAGAVDFDPGIAVSTLTSAGGRDIVVMKLDASGNAVFARRMGGAGDDEATAIALEPSGDIYAGGVLLGHRGF